MVGDALRTVLAQEKPVAFEEIKKEAGGDALVTVRETMVLRDEIQQIRRFFLRGRVEILAPE